MFTQAPMNFQRLAKFRMVKMKIFKDFNFNTQMGVTMTQ